MTASVLVCVFERWRERGVAVRTDLHCIATGARAHHVSVSTGLSFACDSTQKCAMDTLRLLQVKYARIVSEVEYAGVFCLSIK